MFGNWRTTPVSRKSTNDQGRLRFREIGAQAEYTQVAKLKRPRAHLVVIMRTYC